MSHHKDMTVSNEETDYHRRIADAGPARFLDGSSVEIIHDVTLTGAPRFAVFDFDGTLSLIREGWPDVMLPIMVEALTGTGTTETPQQLAAVAREFIAELTGKQTIYQMFRLVEEIRKRDGTPEDPLVYKHRYHERLMQRIDRRREALRDGSVLPEEMLVPGSMAALEILRDRGVQLYLASGTDENYVREEADLLDLAPYFGCHIYGATDDYKAFSKQMVIERILSENHVEGSRLLGFGDGYVEIDNIKTSGGTAIAVASDESGRSGRPDPWKRDRLIGVGADIVIPDFREFDLLCEYLWPNREA